MDFGFETRTLMKSFANSLFRDPQKTGPFYGPRKGPPKNGSIKWTLEGPPYLGESIIPV